GLRQAVRDQLAGFVTDGKGAQLQTFVRNNAGALNAVFTPAEVENLHGLAAALKGAPKARNPLMLDLIAGALGGHFGGLPGFSASSALTHAIQTLRARGIERVDQLVNEAIADPELGRALRAKAPEHRGGTTALDVGVVARAKAIERALARSALIAPK